VTSTSITYDTHCFLCLRTFDETRTGTLEDVIPKWLLKHLDLASTGADLPGGQLFRYTQRKVPCCYPCNQFLSRELEQPMSRAIKSGFEAVQDVHPNVVLLWLAKIYYGTRYRETDLRFDLRDSQAPKMLEVTDLLGRIDYLRRCLRVGPRNLMFMAPPASIWALRAGRPSERRHQFDLSVPVTPGSDFIALRVADTFLMSAFGDNGFWGSKLGSNQLVGACSEMTLHPVQCVELMTWFTVELAGHDSFGCFDFLTVGEEDTPGQQVFFAPRFRVERNDVPQEVLDVARANDFFVRMGTTAPDEVLERARRGAFPTALVNADTDELVHADCFEPMCPEVLNRAGWQMADSPPCPRCGATPRRSA
jgi:hypothetical protein